MINNALPTGGSSQKLGGPNQSWADWAFFSQKVGGPNYMFCPISAKKWWGLGPTGPYPSAGPE